MKRVKKRRRSSPWMSPARNPFDVGGVPLGGVARPPAPTSRGRGRLGRKLATAGKKPPAPGSKRQPSGKSPPRWETEGGRPAPRATPGRGAKIQAGSKKKTKKEQSPARQPTSQARPTPAASRTKKRR